MSQKQDKMEVSIQKHIFREKTPVHRPLKQKLPAQVKGPTNITDRVHQEERQPQQHLMKWVITEVLNNTARTKQNIQVEFIYICMSNLDDSTQKEFGQSFPKTKLTQEEEEETRSKEKNIHLHRHS